MLSERPAHDTDRARRPADRHAKVRSGPGKARNQVARRGAVDHRPHLRDEALHGVDPGHATLAAGPRTDGIGAGSASGADDLGASAAFAAGHDGRRGLAEVADAVAVGVALVLVRFGGTVVAGVAQAVAVGVELIGVDDRRTVVSEGGAARGIVRKDEPAGLADGVVDEGDLLAVRAVVAQGHHHGEAVAGPELPGTGGGERNRRRVREPALSQHGDVGVRRAGGEEVAPRSTPAQHVDLHLDASGYRGGVGGEVEYRTERRHADPIDVRGTGLELGQDRGVCLLSADVAVLWASVDGASGLSRSRVGLPFGMGMSDANVPWRRKRSSSAACATLAPPVAPNKVTSAASA